MRFLFRFFFLSIVASFVLFNAPSATANDAVSKERKRAPNVKPISATMRNGVSIAARDIKPKVRPRVVETPKQIYNRLRRPLPDGFPREDTRILDSALQQSPGGGMPGPLLTFGGIENSDNASETGFIFNPPDTCGDAGPNHYV